MAFDDLDRAEQEEADARAAASEDTSSEISSDATPAATSDDEGGTDDRDAGGDGSDSDGSVDTADPATPAFEFDEAKQRPLYARQGAWDTFEDALAIEVESTLRRNDVRDVPKRELHDAALRVLSEHADEVARRVLAERGVDSDAN
ncbi:hypothetical protein Hbl1158_15935 (plasmid) [Halobaculum sp. CBA1158]|uniref:hypothetical protein n=1 Tax=Halobaculum sp. CBA1158 TaxID=2904243 RepID=UPI001F47C51A|nr:hypothetical protein [Halobaculum sp. CBA1158]UIP01398.1 hypothetical protein Hbl1158_15935 [Halobaculum sp. CBA1158]